jgi:endonuclease YncB( thermonuclease family)
MKKIFAWSLSLILLINFSFVVVADDVPIEEPIEDPIEEPIEEPIEDPIEDPIEEPIEEPIENPIEDPIEEPIEEPIENPIEDPIEEPIEDPIEDPIVEVPVYLYFSEIAWMGTVASSNDEWIEIHNPNDSFVDLSGWVIRSPDSDFEIQLDGIIEPNDYFLLERTDDTTVSDIEADQIYTGALKNDGVFLELVDLSEFIVDEVDMWHSGDNEIKATMARYDFELSGLNPLSWCTSDQLVINGLDADGNPIFGSPIGLNVCETDPVVDPIVDPIVDPVVDPVVNNPPIPIIEIQGDTNYMHVNVTGEESYDSDGDSIIYFWDYGDGFTSDRENPKSYYYATPGEKIISLTVIDEFGLSATADAVFTAKEKSSGGGGVRIVYQPEPVDPLKSYEKGVIVIDSALPNPEGRDSGAESIILKNTSDEIINLKNWKLIDVKDNSKIFDSISIPPNSSLQIGQDVFKIGLNNDREILYLYDPVGNLINEMSWQDAQSGQWIPNLSFLYEGIQGSISDIIDGDTFKIILENQEMTVRIIGVDTPETVHPTQLEEYYGWEASNFLKDLLEGENVTLKFDEDRMDKYGRLLAYVYLGDLFVNAEIIKQGMGYAYIKYPFKYLDNFVRYEEEARLNGVGIWSNSETVKIIDEQIEKEISEDEIDEDLPEDADPSTTLGMTERLHEGMKCMSDFLKIDSILPAPQKGEAVEFIRLINTGIETVCFDGWVLDDVVDGGSKQFVIRGGSIAPGAIRTFRKDETKIALNNSNDCASLIDSSGKLVDQICYNKTHKNEVFTHDGGDWVPKPKASTSKKSSSRSPKRETISYKYDLKTEKAIGNIKLIYEDGELMYLTLDDNSMIQISYAGSSVDINMTKQLLDITQPIEISYLSGGGLNQLISIDQSLQKEDPIEKSSPFLYFFLLLPISAGLFWWRRRYY